MRYDKTSLWSDEMLALMQAPDGSGAPKGVTGLESNGFVLPVGYNSAWAELKDGDDKTQRVRPYTHTLLNTEFRSVADTDAEEVFGPGLHVVVGEPGSGKTLFLRQLQEERINRNGDRDPSIFIQYLEAVDRRLKPVPTIIGGFDEFVRTIGHTIRSMREVPGQRTIFIDSLRAFSISQLDPNSAFLREGRSTGFFIALTMWDAIFENLGVSVIASVAPFERPEDLRQWAMPIVGSVRSTIVVSAGGERVISSRDRDRSWEPIETFKQHRSKQENVTDEIVLTSQPVVTGMAAHPGLYRK